MAEPRNTRLDGKTLDHVIDAELYLRAPGRGGRAELRLVRDTSGDNPQGDATGDEAIAGFDAVANGDGTVREITAEFELVDAKGNVLYEVNVERGTASVVVDEMTDDRAVGVCDREIIVLAAEKLTLKAGGESKTWTAAGEDEPAA